MSVGTYTKTGNKATSPARLDKKVFGIEVKNHDLLKQAYLAYLANSRPNSAITLKRGQVRGGGRKPWPQKGTGRARFGSSRVPIWRGGGITFGPTGDENYSIRMNVKAKRLALRQALSLAADAGKIKIVETFTTMDGKTKDMAKFLAKIDASGKVICVVSEKDPAKERAAQNIPDLKVAGAMSLNVFDVLNADNIIISQKSAQVISDWLGEPVVKVSKATAKLVEARK